MANSIYALTTLGEPSTPDKRVRARTVGIFLTVEEPLKILREGWADLSEGGFYSYAVVEELHLELYPIGNSQFWFRYESSWKSLEKSDLPERFQSKTIGHWATIG